MRTVKPQVLSRHERKLLKNASEPFGGCFDLRKKYPRLAQASVNAVVDVICKWVTDLKEGKFNGTDTYGSANP